MHGTSQGTPVGLSTFGGLVTLASADSLPEGASPRCHDNDYLVGQTKTRAGLTSQYTFSGASVGPDTGGLATDASLGGASWSSIGNVLLNTGVYAEASLPVPLSIASVYVFNETAYSVTSVEVTFASPIPTIVTGQTYTFSGLTVCTSLNGLTLGFPFKAGTNIATFGVPRGSIPLQANTADTGHAIVTGVSNTDGIDVTQLGWSIPPSDAPLGFDIHVRAYASVAGCTLKVQMLKAGNPVGTVKTLPLPTTPTVLNFGSVGDLFGASWVYSDLNNTSFGWRITASSAVPANIFVGYTTLAAYLSASQCNFDFVTTFTAQNGDVKNILLDAIGNLWVENVTSNPGVLALADTGYTPNSFAVGVNGEDVEYLAFNDGFAGSDMPRQYTANWIDRISQVGPGAAPVFTPQADSTDTYNITSITQPAANSDITNPGHISVLLQSSGPSSTAPGNVITVFYSPSFYGGSAHPEAEDTDLVAQFNKGNAVYVYLSGTSFGTGTYLVTSVGNSQPPGVDHYRYYFTVQTPPTVAATFQQVNNGVGQYQRSLATMTMAVPVPGLTVGNQVTITGTSVLSYNATWPISQALNSGAMVITQTSVTAGVATYGYSLVSGTAPAAGELVTITNTTNADGLLNLVNATIATASGGGTGTFTIAVAAPDAVTATEQGQATTAGTIFAFDPGFPLAGTSSPSPIYTSPSTGGSLTFGGVTGQFIGIGTRQGTVFFITRNGYWTAPAPPSIFTVPANTNALRVDKLPIGPPNVIARGIVITEPGQGGVPGANFFCTPQPVNYTVSGITYTSSSFIVWDNTSTSTSLFFTDDVLLQQSESVDGQNFDLFNLIEIGDPGWIVQYDSRNFYGLCRNKIQNFNNLSFDGGFYPGGQVTPLGWSQPDIYGSLLNSPVFGNSYYIKNSTAGTLDTAGLISQTAFQDAYQVAILQPNTAYSVRVTARIPSNLHTGNLVIILTANGITYGTFTLPFASMTSTMAIYEGTLLITELPTIPPALLINLMATGIGAGADVEIDRFDVFPTAIPVLTTTVFGSYANDFESVAATTGQVQFISENQQPVNGAIVLYDTLYALKASSMYSLRSQPNLEPAQWDEPEVAQRAGAAGINSFDFGEQWIVTACRNGVYLYEGGQPGKVMQEIYQVWNAINWEAGQSIWVRNDVVGRHLYIGVPMPTPNFWLPDAPVNANPTSPNVILMMNYQGLDTAQEIKGAPQMHTTMFGTLNAVDMRRKWSIWQIPSPYASFVTTATDKAFYICNGIANSKVYALDENNPTDDGAVIDSRYTTAGIPTFGQRKEIMGLGDDNTRIGFLSLTITLTSHLDVTFFPNQLLGPDSGNYMLGSWTVPGGYNPISGNTWNRKASSNFFANRTYIQLRGAGFTISALMARLRKDVWNGPWGPK